MVSERQLAANRRNAQNSTGPRTAEGKAISRLNAWKHGLSGHTIVVGPEQQEDFQTFHDNLLASFEPKNPVEAVFVNRFIVAAWHSERILRIQTCYFENRFQDCNGTLTGSRKNTSDDAKLAYVFMASTSGLDLLARYDARHELALQRSLRNLATLRKNPGIAKRPELPRDFYDQFLDQFPPMPPDPDDVGQVSDLPSGLALSRIRLGHKIWRWGGHRGVSRGSV